MFHALRQRPVVRKWKIDADGVVAIPYTFRNMNEYEDYEIAAVYDAMWRIGNNTCIHFKERTEERDYVEIKNDINQGCYASVGRTYGKGVVQLEANDWSTCMVPHVVLHELMHVIGLYHEHMRNDRDDYITVNYTNIPRGYWSQFTKVAQPVVFTSVPYDYKSILHYDKTAFSHDGRSTTMTTNDPAYQVRSYAVQRFFLQTCSSRVH
ncbi:astacin [Oesophagostomum dentatum]|uniref:Metalloendopeptidase n=1 Tax=Oesophagostomum dentatum TaxID=61180 RepID=A0A0B1SXV4_OESDE|nr:astacin [Oesophagostomum dentatum]